MKPELKIKLSSGTRYTRPEVKDEIKPEAQMKKYIRPKLKDGIKPGEAYPSKAQDEIK